MVKRLEVVSWTEQRIGHAFDVDGAFGAQCVDLVNVIKRSFWGGGLIGGNAIDMPNTARGAGWSVARPPYSPKPGDFIITREAHQFGHVALMGTGESAYSQNYAQGNIAGGPIKKHHYRAMGTHVAFLIPPYDDKDYAGASDQELFRERRYSVSYKSRSLSYGGRTLDKEYFDVLMYYCIKRHLLPSGVISQLYLESYWGSSNVGRTDNNWSGMTWTGNPNRPSGAKVSRGSARPANEGGHYMRYAHVHDFIIDYTYLIASRDMYNLVGASDITGYTRGLFRIGGARYDYAAVGYAHYLSSMTSLRNSINSANGGVLDQVDEQFRNGTLKVELDGLSGQSTIHYNEVGVMSFLFNVKGDSKWPEGSMFYYNSDINMVQGVPNPEALKYLKQTHMEVYGRPLKEYYWNAKAPVYARIFETVRPGSQDSSIKSELDRLVKELDKAV